MIRKVSKTPYIRPYFFPTSHATPETATPAINKFTSIAHRFRVRLQYTFSLSIVYEIRGSLSLITGTAPDRRTRLPDLH